MRSYFLLLCINLLVTGILYGQTKEYKSDINLELSQQYKSSLAYLESFKIDSAEVIIDSILSEIRETEIENLPFGLRVQSRKAEALERDNKGGLALIAFQQIKEKALEGKVWDVYVHTCINLGLIYEKIGKNIDCLQNLRNAQATLNKYPELDYLYPLFCVRISSYHRIYDDRDSAKYYAQECIRTFEEHGNYAQGGDGYMLMTMLSNNEGIDTQIHYATLAANIFAKLENHSGYSSMLNGISRFHFMKGDNTKALLYNDSTIVAAKRSIDGGFDVYYMLYTAYKTRGEIFNKLNQQDSSFFYMQKGYYIENQQIQKENSSKILAIDAKYKDDKKALIIKEQKEILKSVKIQRLLLMIIFGLVTIFAFGLFYYFNKLRKTKRQTEIQAEQIKKTNQELSKSLNKQIILQGEVHHRVKNNLQVIISLLDLQKERTIDGVVKENIDSMSKRIYSMAAIHNLLYQKEDMEFIKLFDYIENLCYHFSNFSMEEDKPKFTLKIEDINLNLETSMPIGIIITELLTNSLKYARIEGQTLKISIAINSQNEGFNILYKDNGPGFKFEDIKTKSKGLGFYILESMTRQLQGELLRKNEDGAVYEIYLVEKNKRNE